MNRLLWNRPGPAQLRIDIMSNYDYQKDLELVWTHAVNMYKAGVGDPAEMFTREQFEYLASIGQGAQEFFDYAEDYVNGGDPTLGDVAAVAEIRRAYFIEVQKGKPSGKIVSPDDLPSRSAESGGLVWLPRIIAKARCKLRGELHRSVMYGCGGDRAFLKMCDVHPAELLRQAWIHDNDDRAVVDWVLKRFAQRKG